MSGGIGPSPETDRPLLPWTAFLRPDLERGVDVKLVELIGNTIDPIVTSSYHVFPGPKFPKMRHEQIRAHSQSQKC